MQKVLFKYVIEYLEKHNITPVDNAHIPAQTKTFSISYLKNVENAYECVFDSYEILEDSKEIWGIINDRKILLFVW